MEISSNKLLLIKNINPFDLKYNKMRFNIAFLTFNPNFYLILEKASNIFNNLRIYLKIF